MKLSEPVLQQLQIFQRLEITEHHIYKRLARSVKSQENASVLQKIAAFSFVIGYLIRQWLGVNI